MTDAAFLRHVAHMGYSVWEDLDGSTAKRLVLIAQRLEKDDPPPIPQSGK